MKLIKKMIETGNVDDWSIASNIGMNNMGPSNFSYFSYSPKRGSLIFNSSYNPTNWIRGLVIVELE